MPRLRGLVKAHNKKFANHRQPKTKLISIENLQDFYVKFRGVVLAKVAEMLIFGLFYKFRALRIIQVSSQLVT